MRLLLFLCLLLPLAAKADPPTQVPITQKKIKIPKGDRSSQGILKIKDANGYTFPSWFEFLGFYGTDVISMRVAVYDMLKNATVVYDKDGITKATIYFESTDCTGSALVLGTAVMFDNQLIQFRTGAVRVTGKPELVSVRSRENADGTCASVSTNQLVHRNFTDDTFSQGTYINPTVPFKFGR